MTGCPGPTSILIIGESNLGEAESQAADGEL